jgi:O-antigen/teichoic acid export membrane protein
MKLQPRILHYVQDDSYGNGPSTGAWTQFSRQTARSGVKTLSSSHAQSAATAQSGPHASQGSAALNSSTRSLFQFGRSRRSLTILDQAIVSGSNFITGIILVRGLGLVEFGRFTIAYAILLLANSVQLSFISSPMITLGSLSVTPEERRRFVRGMFGVQMIFCAAASILAVAGTAVYVSVRHSEGAMEFLLPFASAVVAFLMQDWLRRYYFTVDKAFASLGNDVISYLGQVVVLGLLWWAHRLTLNAALWSIAVTSGGAFAVGALLERLASTRAETREAWRQAHGISIDLGIANQLQWLVYQGAMLIGAGVVGAQAAGGVRATQNIVGPVNVAYQAMENIVPLRAAEEMKRGGIERVSAFLFRFGAIGFLGLLVFFSAAALFSRQFLSFFYGRQLHAFAGVLDLQMLYFLLTWPIRQVSFLFRTIKYTRPILIGSLVAAVVSLVAVYPGVRAFGAVGIMLAAVAAQIANLAYMALIWVRLPKVPPESFEAQQEL